MEAAQTEALGARARTCSLTAVATLRVRPRCSCWNYRSVDALVRGPVVEKDVVTSLPARTSDSAWKSTQLWSELPVARTSIALTTRVESTGVTTNARLDALFGFIGADAGNAAAETMGRRNGATYETAATLNTWPHGGTRHSTGNERSRNLLRRATCAVGPSRRVASVSAGQHGHRVVHQYLRRTKANQSSRILRTKQTAKAPLDRPGLWRSTMGRRPGGSIVA